MLKLNVYLLYSNAQIIYNNNFKKNKKNHTSSTLDSYTLSLFSPTQILHTQDTLPTEAKTQTQNPSSSLEQRGEKHPENSTLQFNQEMLSIIK